MPDIFNRADDCGKPDQCFSENGTAANNPKSPLTEPTCDEFDRGFACDSKNLTGKLNWWFNRLSCAIKDLLIRVEALELREDTDTIVGDYVLTNPMDGDGILVLTAPVLDKTGNPTGDTRTITLAEPAAPTAAETDGMHYSGVPTMDSSYIVTYPRVNDLDESPAPPVTLDLSPLISSAHPTYNFSGDLTATANASGGFDVSYDDPDLVGAGGITTAQNADGDWVITGAPAGSDTFGTTTTNTSGVAITTTNGVIVPSGGFYVLFPDGTTFTSPLTTTPPSVGVFARGVGTVADGITTLLTTLAQVAGQQTFTDSTLSGGVFTIGANDAGVWNLNLWFNAPTAPV